MIATVGGLVIPLILTIFFRRWLCMEAASGLERILCGELGRRNTRKALTHYQMTNFKLFQTERVCRRQFQI